MPKLFSYVVDHDYGYAPCPFGGFCTLAKCKYGTIKCKSGMRRNIVELAEEGDWIAGTGGVNLNKSAGHGMDYFPGNSLENFIPSFIHQQVGRCIEG